MARVSRRRCIAVSSVLIATTAAAQTFTLSPGSATAPPPAGGAPCRLAPFSPDADS